MSDRQSIEPLLETLWRDVAVIKLPKMARLVSQVAADARNSIAQSGPYAYMMVQTDYRHLYMLLASNEAILAGFLENSHDLMNNLKVALDVAESGEDGSELMACAQLMGEVIERQEKMVVDLLQMAQLKEKAQAHHFEYEELSRTIGVRN